MARRIRNTGFENRANRLKLPIAKKPAFVRVGPGVSVGYRRNLTAGTWVVRVADGKGGNWTKAIASADDFDEADGTRFLSFWQATEQAKRVAGKGSGTSEAALTVSEAVERYKADLAARGGDLGNVVRLKGHLPDKLARRPVALLTTSELSGWRNGLLKDMAPASVNRVCTSLRAALNLVADSNSTIGNRAAWDVGLKAIPDATETRNVVLSDAEVRRVVKTAKREGAEFGLFVEVAAVTGARASQIARLTVRDLKADALDMPSSRKGKGVKKVVRRQVPIPASLAKRLQTKRPDDAPLLVKPSGEAWAKSDHTRPFRRAAKKAGLNPDEATIYALRHSSITRQLLRGVPIRVVASLHDTSVAMIERTYSVDIDQHVDAIVRPALIALR
jgi:integrase